MTTYRAGQRVRIEWVRDNAVMEGLLVNPRTGLGLSLDMPDNYHELESLPGYCIVTVLSEPRLAEPVGLGAVVDAKLGITSWLFIRIYGAGGPGEYPWRAVDPECHLARHMYVWDDLLDPVVLSEGWQP